MTRRELLRTLAALGLVSGCRARPGSDVDACTLPPLTAKPPIDEASFRHGVASGDPGLDRVILWTRVEPDTSSAASSEAVEYVVARDPELLDVVASGHASTDIDRDFTVKVDVMGLEPDTTYYYRFARARPDPCIYPRSMTAKPEPIGGPPAPIRASAIGRTKTLPIDPERVRLAFCSCANYPQGFFNVYAAIARRDELDAVLHLGDYLYEYAEGRYGDGARLGRSVEPKTELVTLDDYRTRHALYKRDPDLQEVHRKHPFIAVWDDHEIANDACVDGAQNHDPSTQGDWQQRRAAAIRAYYEWMPIREPSPDSSATVYRSFRFGELADLLMLDTRLSGRDRQAELEDHASRDDPSRTLLGAEQEAWLFERLSSSASEGVAWRLIGQQVIFGQVRFDPQKPPDNDPWDGYPAARARVLAHLREARIEDVAVLTGDIHSSWALEVGDDPWSDDPARRAPQLVEFVTPAVSSPGPVPAERADELAIDFAARHPHVRWVELKTRGYVTLDIRRERIQADWWFVDTVEERRADERFARGFVVERGAVRLREVDRPAS